MKKTLYIFVLFVSVNLLAQESLTYQKPAPSIASLIEAPFTPLFRLSPDRVWSAYLGRPGYPSIAELSKPELRLAGLRINPELFTGSRQNTQNSLEIKKILTGEKLNIKGLPEKIRFSSFNFSPKGSYASMLIHEDDGLYLWVISLNSGEAKKFSEKKIHDILIGYNWLSDESGIVFGSIPEGRKPPESQTSIPTGPIIEENLGKKAPSRTFQDLLKSPHDEALFEYYLTTEVFLKTITGKEDLLLPSAPYSGVDPAPGAKEIMVSLIKRPFSYLVPFNRFPQEIFVIGLNGERIKTLAEIPLLDNIPNGFNAVEKGPRRFSWRSDVPNTIYYFEALDDGDPRKAAEKRDALFLWNSPFNDSPKLIAELSLRAGSVIWGNSETALITESWWSDRKTRTHIIDPTGKNKPKVLFDRSYEDRYSDPGSPLTTPNDYGFNVLAFNKNGEIWLAGSGASDEGDYPFIDLMSLKTFKKDRLWQCQKNYFETPVAVLDFQKGLFITSRESKTEQPNYFLRQLGTKKLIPVTKYPNPYPALEGIQKQVLKYKREDGVDLTADLYLPANYQKQQGPLPTLIWAYPREFKSGDAASQVRGSLHTFVRISWASPLFWVTRGYAIIDNAAMPIVGEGNKEPNDTFIQQLVSSAKAAISCSSSMGVVDSTRVAVGGHSYGAFMTANLLAHSDLFKTGIARSGAYNRTLTPFGFQSEERTYWEAPEVYNAMSPFSHANKINEPILLIHGEADNNTGTFPLQSERLYNAIKGHGGYARYVVLPAESHGYAAEESILHMLWEMDRWLEMHLKTP